VFAGIPVAFLAAALPFDLYLVCSHVLGTVTLTFFLSRQGRGEV
jgi:hypothetical protein